VGHAVGRCIVQFFSQSRRHSVQAVGIWLVDWLESWWVALLLGWLVAWWFDWWVVLFGLVGWFVGRYIACLVGR